MRIITPKFYLPKTGQTTSTATGDDGDLLAGSPITTRFIDNGNNTITDRATHLVWIKDASQLGAPFGTPGSPATMTWANAVANCLGSALGGGGLSYAGRDDWRLPNLMELFTLWKGSAATAPSAYADFTTVSGNYWSSTVRGAGFGATYAAYINFATSYTPVVVPAMTGSFYVRPVCGGVLNGI